MELTGLLALQSDMSTRTKPDPFEAYEALPASYHKDPRWAQVRQLRKEGKHLEANGLVGQIRQDYGFL